LTLVPKVRDGKGMRRDLAWISPLLREYNSRTGIAIIPVVLFSIQQYNVLTNSVGGMERAIEMITEAKGPGSEPVIVDRHPARPDYRGFMAGPNPISMQADPAFSEIEAAGGKIEKNADTHTVLDDMFLISGMIPRVTSYEKGLSNGIRFENEKGIWVKDEEIADERF
jgi:hypothetical protein